MEEGGYKSCSVSLRPKSPPPGPVDFHAKRNIQVLETEIAFLQEELKSLESLHPASRCCKELYAFVGSVPDPFTPTLKEKISKSHHFSLGRACCCNSWVVHKKMGKGCCCCCCKCSSSNIKCCGCGSTCFKSASRCAQNCCF